MACLIEMHNKNCQPKFPSHKIVDFTLRNIYSEAQHPGLYFSSQYIPRREPSKHLELVLGQLTNEEAGYLHNKCRSAELIEIVYKHFHNNIVTGVITGVDTMPTSSGCFNAILCINVTQITNNVPKPKTFKDVLNNPLGTKATVSTKLYGRSAVQMYIDEISSDYDISGCLTRRQQC